MLIGRPSQIADGDPTILSQKWSKRFLQRTKNGPSTWFPSDFAALAAVLKVLNPQASRKSRLDCIVAALQETR
jgi:hypothetical protein